MLNMYSDHYRLIANHADGARARRFRMRPKRLPRKVSPETGTRVEPKGPRELLELLERSHAEALRVARATGLARDQRVAWEANQRLEDHRRTTLLANWTLGCRERDGGFDSALRSKGHATGATP